MKKSELINRLNEISIEDYEVSLFDWRQNMIEGDNSSKGIHIKFDVELIDNDAEDKTQDKFIALSFENEDYNK